jgi:hypothetical protein
MAATPQAGQAARRQALARCGWLGALLVAAHFLPWERASLSPDSYVHLLRAQGRSVKELAGIAADYPDRPLNQLVLLLQAKLAGDNPVVGLWLVAGSGVLLLGAAYGLLRRWLGTPWLAFLAAALFCVLPNQVEVYHSTVFVNINVAIALYLGSLALFMAYAQTGRRRTLGLSLLAYAAGVFWYELGFFIPLVMLAYRPLAGRRRLYAVAGFGAIAAGYLAYRFTDGFGLGDAAFLTHPPLTWDALAGWPRNLGEFWHHYAGRYLARHVIYGGLLVWAMEPQWLAALVTADVALVWWLWRWTAGAPPPRIDAGALRLALLIMAAFALPPLLNTTGGVASRHLVPMAVGLVVVLLAGLHRLGRWWRPALVSAMAAGLLVCQGNAWAQVVACRINAAVYAALREQGERLRQAAAVVVDTRSFAERIPYTLVRNDLNVLNTYYGAQAFEPWGLQSMARLAAGRPDLPVHVAIDRPRRRPDAGWDVTVFDYTGYRAATRVTHQLPARGTVVIDYATVYAGGDDRGRRRRVGTGPAISSRPTPQAGRL